MNVINRATERLAPSMVCGSIGKHLFLVVVVAWASCGRQNGLHPSGTNPVPDAAVGGSGGSGFGGNTNAGGAMAGGGTTSFQDGGAVPSSGGASGATSAVGGVGGNAGASSSTGGVPARGGVTFQGGSAGASGGMAGGGTTFLQGGGGVSGGGTSGATTGGASSGGTAGASSMGGSGTARGGATSLGGSAGGGGMADGGAARGGTTSSGGSSSGGEDGGGPDGGIVASGYCTGSSSKVTYLGQTVSAPATNYQSSLAFDCCMAYGVNLHTDASLGLDFQVEVIAAVGVLAGDYEVGKKVRAPVRTSNEPANPAGNTSGNVHVVTGPSVAQAWELGLCLEVDDTSSALLGTKIYVPSVTMVPNYQWNKRFQIYLLQDSSIGTLGAATLAIDSLVLAAQPLLDLSRIAYVEQATTRIGLNPGQKLGDSIRSQLGQTLGLPFVVVVDGVRIYLGTFMSDISSIPPAGPVIVTDEITADGLAIQPPWTGTDPRNDPRIIQALTEAGKLVP